MSWIDILGYVASAFVAASFLFSSMVKLRIVNLIGCITFVVYGVFIDSMPVILTNAFISCVNIYQLSKASKKS